ncbi:PLP-dependent aminotransferase family protein [candidate division KSB1 bacterium]|nr:PLP-dependent aminotransferase family protein [candidate division KSB1 bacterium]
MHTQTASMKAHLYEKVAGRITTMIEKGTLRPGERVPSVRKLNEQLGVSMSTVLQAYALLEDRGVLEARPQSGFYVRLRQRELPPEPRTSKPTISATKVDISLLAEEVHEAALNPHNVPLGCATGSPDLLPSAKLNRLLGAIARRSVSATNRYDSPQGHHELLHQIARRSLDWGCHLTSEDLIITFGATEALNLCLRAVTKPGDTIAVESPTYFGFLQILESLNLKALEIPTHPREGMSLEGLETALRREKIAACFVVGNFHNPLGSCMPEANKKALVETLSRRGIPLLEDDVYGDLFFGNSRPKPCKAFDKHGMVLTCSSFSKTLSPGYRVGWAAPGKFREHVRRLKLTNTISTATLPQMAIAEMLQNGGYDRYMRHLRKVYEMQMQVMSQAICKYFPESTKITRPMGGHVLWVEFPIAVDSFELYHKALEKNISIVPGPLFSPKRLYRNFIRLNCGYPYTERIERAMITLGQIAARML